MILSFRYNIKIVRGNMNCVKNVRIRSFSGPYFPSFGLNTERYRVSLRIQSKCGKMQTRKTPNRGTFCAVMANIVLFQSIRNTDIGGKAFINGLSKICERQPLKNLKEYDLFKQTILLQLF